EGWQSYFVTIQTSDDHPSKPHPSMLLKAMVEAGVEPGDTVMVGDTTYDVEMARAANVPSIGVAWGYHSVAELTNAGANRIVDSFSDLPGALDELLGTPGYVA